MSELQMGFMLMGYGLLGVFTVLVTFYLAIKLMMRLFREKTEKQ